MKSESFSMLARSKRKVHWPLLFGLFVMGVFLLCSFFPEIVAPYGPKETFSPWQKPSTAHLLGTNDLGYDIASELVFATAQTLFTGITSAAFALVAGTAIGALSGYFGGWASHMLNLIIDVFLLIPMLPMCIVLTVFLSPSTQTTMFVIAMFAWCSTAKAVRAKTFQLKQTDFIDSLHILGLSRWRIVFRHIIPNLSDIVLARYVVSAANCILTEASISFIGLGNPVNVTWGGMINIAFRRGGFTRGDFNWFLPPGICIVLCVLAFYAINIYFEQRNKAVVSEKIGYLD